MVDVKTEPGAACASSDSLAATSESTTTTATESDATTTTPTASDTGQTDKNIDIKIKVAQASEQTPNDNNNNNGDGGPEGDDDDDDDDDDAEFDEEDETNNHRNGGANACYSKDDGEKTNLIVNYLPQQMTDEEFEELFKRFGKMKSCKIVRNRQTGYSYGFGFVDFETHDQALAAIEQLNGQEVDTKKIKVAFARPAGQDIKQANLYVKNVPTAWSQDDVRKVFEPYGSIIQVRVLGNNRGVAFVLFDLRKQAQDALDALNGKQVDGCEAPFEIKFAAEKKGEKQRGSRGGSGRNRRGNRGGNFNRNNQNQSNNFNSNNNNRNNRSNSNNRRGTSQNRGGNMYNNSSNYGSMNGGVGPMRQQQTNRSNRFSPFVQMQQPQQTAPMTPYGYAQQPMLPYVVQGPSVMQGSSVMQGAPVMQGPSVMQMGSAPVNPYSMGAQMGPIGYVQPPMAQPSAAMTNMYNVASTTMNNAAQMQPQLGQPMNMRGNSSGGGGGGGGGSGGGHNDGVTLFVYNIGPDCDETELKEMFTPYGTVTRCNVVRKTPGGETKGFGFVTLRSRDHANAAIAGLNNTMRNGRSLQVSFKK